MLPDPRREGDNGAIQKLCPAQPRCAQALCGHLQPRHPAEHPGKRGCCKAVARRMLRVVSGTAVQSPTLGHSSHQKPSPKNKKKAFHWRFWITSKRHATDGVIGVATDQTLSITHHCPHIALRWEKGFGSTSHLSPPGMLWEEHSSVLSCLETAPRLLPLCLLPPGSSMRIQPELSGVSITPSPSGNPSKIERQHKLALLQPTKPLCAQL